mgnify:CR=1 FL=1
MNRTIISCATVPFLIAVAMVAACTADPGTDDGNEDEDETATGVNVSMTNATNTNTDPTIPGDGDGDGDSGDGDGDEDPGCGDVSIVPTYTPPNVMLVVDASGSMVANSWDHDLDPNTPDVTRWNSLHGVVTTVMDQFGTAMLAGIQRFPSADACPDATANSSNCYNSDSCIVGNVPEVGVGFDNGAAILAAIPGPDADNVAIVGGTPATKGITSAVNHLLDQDGANPNYILFITDGAANCMDGKVTPPLIEDYDENLPTTVESAYMDDAITTFVVGIDIIDLFTGDGIDGSPAANPFERLNDVAVAGGAPKNMGMDAEKFFNSTNQDELLDELSGIIDEITECVIDLNTTEEGPPPENQIPFVSFEVDGAMIEGPLTLEECMTMDGWAWLEYGTVVTFCGAPCDQFKLGTGVFDGTYGCPPPV